jgi:hypothetical protein
VKAEHQLIHWQKLGLLKGIFANDSDYIFLGGKNIILDSKNNTFSHAVAAVSGRDQNSLQTPISSKATHERRWPDSHGYGGRF